MSARLTKQWTATAAEAFGDRGQRGRTAELHLASLLCHLTQLEVQDFEEDYEKQVAGIDLQVGQFSLDVKANLYKNAFFIETNSRGWLFNPSKTSDIIVHVDQLQDGALVWYKRCEAKKTIREQPQNGSRPHLLKIDEKNFRPDFMSRSLADLVKLLQGC